MKLFGLALHVERGVYYQGDISIPLCKYRDNDTVTLTVSNRVWNDACNITHCTYSVSYTHLDVYKRQVCVVSYVIVTLLYLIMHMCIHIYIYIMLGFV